MGYHKNELKRLQRTRKLLAKQSALLHEMALEGLVSVTLRTPTRSITISAEHIDTQDWHDALARRRRTLKEEMKTSREQLRHDEDLIEHNRAFLEAARKAADQGLPPVSYQNFKP